MSPLYQAGTTKVVPYIPGTTKGVPYAPGTPKGVALRPAVPIVEERDARLLQPVAQLSLRGAGAENGHYVEIRPGPCPRRRR